MLLYISQIVIFQLLFLLVYELMFKKETFFSYNRIYLLLTPVLSFLLPFLKISGLESAVPVETINLLPEVFIASSSNAVASVGASEVVENQISFRWVLEVIYFTGLVVSLIIFLLKIRNLAELFKYKSVPGKADSRIVEVPNSVVACTFFNTIFLGDKLGENEREQILSHELVHVKQRHTLDLLFFEFLKLIFWFNPVIYIYQSRISTLHEFLADAGVVKNVKKQDYFQQLLNSAFNTQNISFINQFFNHSIIKKRIVMLQKSRSRSTSKFKFLIILPLMLAMLTYVSCSEDPVVNQEEKEETAQEKLEEIKAIINDGTEFTADDKERVAEILSTISKKDLDKAVNGAESAKVQKVKKAVSGTGDIPFAVIEEVPVYPGCESLTSNEDRKTCMSQKITEVIGQNFNASLGKDLGLTGINRIYVQFKIARDGKVEIMGVRAKHPALEEEARRVVNLLPKMTPGKQKGQEVGVLYSLPITFEVGE